MYINLCRYIIPYRYDQGYCCGGFGFWKSKDPWMVEIPCKDRERPSQRSTMRVPVILPHELLNWLGENNRFHIDQTVRKQFWNRWQEFKEFHPAACDGQHNPVAITGDDAKYTLGGSKVIVIAMSLVLLDRMKGRTNDLLSSLSEKIINVVYVLFAPWCLMIISGFDPS